MCLLPTPHASSKVPVNPPGSLPHSCPGPRPPLPLAPPFPHPEQLLLPSAPPRTQPGAHPLFSEGFVLPDFTEGHLLLEIQLPLLFLRPLLTHGHMSRLKPPILPSWFSVLWPSSLKTQILSFHFAEPCRSHPQLSGHLHISKNLEGLSTLGPWLNSTEEREETL